MIWTRLYDPDRTPDHWTELIHEGDYCVFLLEASDRTPRDMDGNAFSPGQEAVAICGDLDDASRLANSIVKLHPQLCAEIYDHTGKSGEPLQVVYEPSVRGKYVGRPFAKREALRGMAILAAGIFFIVLDVRHDLRWMWGYILGLKLTVVGGSFTARGLIGLYEHRAERR